VTGYQAGLRDPRLMARKAQEEKAMRARLATLPSSPEHKAMAAAWDEIARANSAQVGFYARYSALEQRAGREAHLLGLARDIVRLVEEKSKPNEKRLREYRDSAMASLEHELDSKAPVYPELETATLAFYLEDLARKLGANDSTLKAALAGRSPAELARAAVQGTTLADPAARRKLVEGGAAAVAASKDP